MTVKLNTCRFCRSAAVAQIRGQMGPGDYKEVQKQNNKGRWIDDPDFYKDVYLDSHNRDDFRVSCSKCDNATPWNKPDAPNMPGVGKGFSIEMWNKLNP